MEPQCLYYDRSERNSKTCTPLTELSTRVALDL